MLQSFDKLFQNLAIDICFQSMIQLEMDFCIRGEGQYLIKINEIPIEKGGNFRKSANFWFNY